MMNGDITEHSDKTTTVGMWKDEYRLKIKNITFSNDLSNLPSSCTEANLCWDITDSESIYPVYHYLVQNETDTTKYDAYIVSEEKIYAPKDSSGMFEYVAKNLEVTCLTLKILILTTILIHLK